MKNKKCSYLFAVDCGSTNLKGAVFDDGLKRLGEKQIPLVYSLNKGEYVEFSAAEFRRSVMQLFTDTCDDAGIDTERINKICITSQAQTFALLGADKRTPVTPFISWLDRRAAVEGEQINQALVENFHSHSSFAPAGAQLMASKVLWLQKRREDFSKCSICSLPGYLSLCFGASNVMDNNLAAMSGLFSLAEADWWPEMMNACGIVTAQMPEWVSVGSARAAEIQGKDELAPKLAADLEIVYAGNDQTAGAFGNDCEKYGVVATLGTALVAYRHAGRHPGPYHEGGCWGPYPSGGYYELATRDAGCRAFDWARRQLLPAADIEDAIKAVESVSTTGAMDECFFFPQCAESANSWCGSGSVEMKLYAVMEGITFCLKKLVFETLETARTNTSLVTIGGGAKSDVWLQMIADALMLPVYRGWGDSLLGAAKMGARDKRQHNVVGDPLLPQQEKVKLMAQRYKKWCNYRLQSNQ